MEENLEAAIAMQSQKIHMESLQECYSNNDESAALLCGLMTWCVLSVHNTMRIYSIPYGHVRI